MSKDDLVRAVTDMRAACPAYDLAEAFYNGTRPELFSSPELERRLRRTKDRYKLNFAQVPVNAVADKLKITAITVVNDKGEDDKPLTSLFDEKAWRINQMAKRQDEVMRKACMFGDSYLFVWPDEDEENPSVIMVYNNPKTSRMMYDRDIPHRKAFYAKHWQELDGTIQARLYYPDHFEKYHAPPKTRKLDDVNVWVTDDQEPNPHDEIPVWHFRSTADQYGKPLHLNAYGAQDAINKLSTTLVHSGEFEGWPQRYGLTEPSASLSGEHVNAVDWDDEADITDPSQLQGRSRLKNAPGSIQVLPGMKSVGQWAAAQATNFIDPLSFYIRAMSELTGTPLNEFDTTGGAPSGETLNAVRQPLNDHIVSLWTSFTPDWQQSSQFALKLLGKSDTQVNIQWQSPFPVNDKEGWEVIEAKIRNGVPRQQALVEAGYSPSQVAAWITT